MTQPVSDQDRKKLEAALAAAILLRYRASHTAARKKLGQPDRTPSKDAQKRISAFAKDRSTKVKDGINTRMAAALAALPDDASEADRQQATAEAQQKIQDHHDTTLIPFMLSWGDHQGLIDAYSESPDPGGSDQSALDATLWVWQQTTAFQDDCTEAMEASPAPLEELLAISGGPPPVHENCQCFLDSA